MKAYVIDSNMLQSDELRRYFKQESGNLAILPDFAWYELYKQQSLEGLRLGLSVVGDHPEQVILLRSGGHISRLDPAVAEDLNRLVFDGPDLPRKSWRNNGRSCGGSADLVMGLGTNPATFLDRGRVGHRRVFS
ncbi:hypothetical protein [Rhizobium aegyptiacum]|uniref:hypothetical protein n=1 Tax=Rhizobium aegyptiacum TaxID=1764550 RepID=UPI000B1670D3|nr:hypothetical protein [Rhizobium aegyptiacum]